MQMVRICDWFQARWEFAPVNRCALCHEVRCQIWVPFEGGSVIGLQEALEILRQDTVARRRLRSWRLLVSAATVVAYANVGRVGTPYLLFGQPQRRRKTVGQLP
jgi:hypothetical protein